jgi:hypothetical protein
MEIYQQRKENFAFSKNLVFSYICSSVGNENLRNSWNFRVSWKFRRNWNFRSGWRISMNMSLTVSFIFEFGTVWLLVLGSLSLSEDSRSYCWIFVRIIELQPIFTVRRADHRYQFI